MNVGELIHPMNFLYFCLGIINHGEIGVIIIITITSPSELFDALITELVTTSHSTEMSRSWYLSSARKGLGPLEVKTKM